MDRQAEKQFDREAIGYLRLQMAVKHPNIEECWQDGYECGSRNIGEEENPFKPGSLEFQGWQDGWWAGYFGETPLAAKAPISVFKTNLFKKIHQIHAKHEASNEPFWTHERKILFFKRTVQITGIILVAALAYELAELVA